MKVTLVDKIPKFNPKLCAYCQKKSIISTEIYIAPKGILHRIFFLPFDKYGYCCINHAEITGSMEFRDIKNYFAKYNWKVRENA